MNTVAYHILNDSIVLNFSGKTEVISKSDARYDKVINAIRSNTLDSIPDLVDLSKAFEGTGLALRDGVLYDGETAIPTELNSRILRFRDEGLPFAPLIKFWDNLKQNPSFNSRKMLYKFLEHNGHPLTQEGEFIAYRGVTEDFKDLHTRTFDNKPGSICEVSRDQVDDNPNNTCSFGLHVACFDYARGFGPKLVEVKVNPKDVVTVPTDYNGTKMRVSRFEVVREGEALRTEAIYGHEPDTSDEEYDAEIDAESDAQDEFDAVCANCGHENDLDANYCSECGDDLGNPHN